MAANPKKCFIKTALEKLFRRSRRMEGKPLPVASPEAAENASARVLLMPAEDSRAAAPGWDSEAARRALLALDHKHTPMH